MENTSYSNVYFRFKGLVYQTYMSFMAHFKTAKFHTKEVKNVAPQHVFGDGATKKEDDGMTRHLQQLKSTIAANKSGNMVMEQ